MESKELRSKVINHLGLVGGMYDELGIGKTIDSLLIQDMDNRLISIGTICKALVLNGLGFTERTLYMVTDFFNDKPTEILLGEGVSPNHLNDSVLGRALDDIHAFGTTQLYQCLVPVICESLGLSPSRFAHMDSTDFHLDGQYNSSQPSVGTDKTIHLTKGYSRDHRPDLNQVVLNLIVENEAGIPLHMEALSGNSSDKTVFRATVKEHIEQLQNTTPFEYLVMDSAGYTAQSISEYRDKLKWISRVPESLSECRQAISAPQKLKALDEKYSYLRLESNYAGTEQRWLLVWSQEAYEREVRTLAKNWAKKSGKESKAWLSLCRQEFACSADAEKAAEKFKKKSKCLVISGLGLELVPKYLKKGRPSKNSAPDTYAYRIKGFMSCPISAYKKEKNRKGKFIIATNELDTERLSDKELLKAYKGQSRVERGFRFLKDPQFVARNFFVKKAERLEALVFIMTLCLTVYAALEYKIRRHLEEMNECIPNQLGKPVKNPTARWVFTLFRGVHFLYGLREKEPICLNFNKVHIQVTNILGRNYKKYYLRI